MATITRTLRVIGYIKTKGWGWGGGSVDKVMCKYEDLGLNDEYLST